MGRKLAILTTKPDFIAKQVLREIEFSQYFDFIYGVGTAEWKKPDGLAIDFIARKLKVLLSNIIMIGDSKTDLLTARNAKVDFVAVSYGTLNEREFHNLEAGVIDNLLNLLN